MRVIEVQKTQYKVSDFVSWQKQGCLDLSPEFQRRPVWKKGAKSYLIDTILRGFPIPIIFLREKLDLSSMEPRREVVDGQQRLRTLMAYIDPKLLEDFNPEQDEFRLSKTHNEDYANSSFQELPDEAKKDLLDYQFSVHILPSGISDREVLQVFSRMNATGVKLNAQELRNAEYYGEFKTAVYNAAFAQIDRWKDWGVFTNANISRMEEVEFVSDLFTLIMKGVQTNTKRSLDGMYEKYDVNFNDRSAVELRFDTVMECLEGKFRHVFNEVKQVRNKNVFFIVFAVFYEKLYGIGTPLRSRPPKKIKASFLKELRQKLSIFDDPEAPDEFDTRRLGQQDARQKAINYLVK